ncbi:MAG: DIP1984 family protein [Erysipelotrichaceae bacterium]|nr:DIP1984 family protein [Erysipelotrichaceae bacterium]
MKLAEALQERADHNRRIEQLRSRLLNNALKQEGEEPAEDPDELLKQLNECIDAQQKLIAAINLANAKTEVDGKTLTEMIAERDMLNIRINAYRDLINEASMTYQRARNSEIRILSAVNVKELQKKADALSHELRILDNRIQQTNWLTEL